MKTLITKYWPLIGLIASFLIERSLNIFDWMGLSPDQADIAKAFGTLLYGYFFTSKYNAEVQSTKRKVGAPRPTK